MKALMSNTGIRARNIAGRVHHPLAVSFVIWFAHGLLMWNDRYRTRQEMKRMTPEQLDDIGITRSEMAREARKPFWLP